MRSARVGGLTLVSTEVPAGSQLIRLHVGDDPEYERMILVTPEDNGKTLHLAGWIGQPLAPSQWREASAQLFPAARVVRWERLRADGTFSHRRLRLT